MPRTSLLFLSFALVFSMSAGACGDDGGPNISLTDSGPADATPPSDAGPPDAFVCTLTDCGGACIDTTSDSLNCGGCGLACATPGQICSGSLPCACPADFVPASIGGGFDQVFMQAAAIAAIAPVAFSPISIVAVVYDLTLTIDTDYDLAVSLATLTPPSVALGYDVNINAFTAKTAYGATTGTIRFDTICADGASGTITSPVFTEVGGITDLAPLLNGCTLSYETLAFDIGTCLAP